MTALEAAATSQRTQSRARVSRRARRGSLPRLNWSLIRAASLLLLIGRWPIKKKMEIKNRARPVTSRKGDVMC